MTTVTAQDIGLEHTLGELGFSPGSLAENRHFPLLWKRNSLICEALLPSEKMRPMYRKKEAKSP